MTATQELKLKDTVEQAMKKIGASKESDLCRYLPSSGGGYIHHFTYNKLKKTSPGECVSLIEEFILKNHNLKQLDPKPRAPRNSKQPDLSLPNEMFLQVLKLAQEANNQELLARLLGSKPLNQIKRELISSIRAEKVDVALWEAYTNSLLTAKH